MSAFGSSRSITVILLLAIAVTMARAEASTQAREITSNEAHDLLTAFLKAPGGVEQSGDLGYKEFYFFMAIMGSSCSPDGVCVGNFQYYAIDRRTGDVWSAIICKRIATRSLSKLQKALRKRIGLMNDDYKGLRRQGPLCETGMPRGK